MSGVRSSSPRARRSCSTCDAGGGSEGPGGGAMRDPRPATLDALPPPPRHRSARGGRGGPGGGCRRWRDPLAVTTALRSRTGPPRGGRPPRRHPAAARTSAWRRAILQGSCATRRGARTPSQPSRAPASPRLPARPAPACCRSPTAPSGSGPDHSGQHASGLWAKWGSTEAAARRGGAAEAAGGPGRAARPRPVWGGVLVRPTGPPGAALLALRAHWPGLRLDIHPLRWP
jgi:hypothetical protein